VPGAQRSVRIGVLVLAAAAALVFAWIAFARYATFHNRSFDLAFYARLAWGLARGRTYEPLVGAHVFGLHLSPVLVPLGLLGAAFGTVRVLLVAQALAVAATAWPLARIGARRFGDLGALAGAGALLLHPNLAPVVSEAFHPGTLAVLPLAWAIDALDRRDPRAFVASVVGVLACREDLAIATAVLGWLFARDGDAAARRLGRKVTIVSLAWFAVWAAVLLPIFGPRGGSFAMHFGRFVHSPGELLGHLAAPARLLYLPTVLATVALLPLLRPRLLLPVLPLLLVNLVSAFPTTTDVASHYLTPALPFVVAAALDGASRLGRFAAVLPALAAMAWTSFAVPIALADLRPDERSAQARRIVAAVPQARSVQGPGFLLAHLAERSLVYRGPPPDRQASFVILDVSHRRRYARQETLLRTREEPIVRRWLARPDHALVRLERDFLLLRRGRSPRRGLGARAIRGTTSPDQGDALSACLALRGASLAGARLHLDLVARAPCPADIGLRIGTADKPRRVDLLFDGLFSPVHLRPGDLVRSSHPLDPTERAAALQGELRVGLLRSGGARIDRADPLSVAVQLAPR